MIRKATEADAPALTALINLAFQVERFFLDSDRLDLSEVLDRLKKGCFLIEVDHGSMAACVYVELRADRCYLGLLSVDPSLQRSGIGKRLVAAAEDFARAAGCLHTDLKVVNLREELPPFYRRLGYKAVEASPFPSEIQTKLPCHFIHMTKAL
jgi:N-acetylglutamate synthase-like GNAT family acetyltransferase